jgi:hypothetical protein
VDFVRPHGLLEWWQTPQEIIAKIAHLAPLAAVVYVVAFAALFAGYVLAARIARGKRRASVWGVVIGGALAFNALLLFLYPVDAADVFDNILHGRMTAVHGANVFYQVPVRFSRDRFFPYAAWDYSPTAYGPGWEFMAAGAARLAGDGVIANVLRFKSIGVAAYAGAAALIALTLLKTAPDRALSGTVLFAWNPLVLYVTSGNGHNDAMMVLFIALAFYLLASNRLTLAALALTLGASVKFIPALLLPVVIVAGFKQAKGWRARLIFLGITAVLCAAVGIGLSAPFWQGGDILGFKRRSD